MRHITYGEHMPVLTHPNAKAMRIHDQVTAKIRQVSTALARAKSAGNFSVAAELSGQLTAYKFCEKLLQDAISA